MTIQTNKNITPTKPERVSVPGIKNKANKNREKEYAYGRKGSVTIEASLGIPLFLFAALCLIWLIEIQSIRISVIDAAQNAAKSAAMQTDAQNQDNVNADGGDNNA